MPAEAIEAVIGAIDRRTAPADPSVAAASPGLLESHYAPRTRLYLVEAGAIASARPTGRAAALALSESSLAALRAAGAGFALARCLSPSGDLVEAAAGLFANLHELDAGGFDEIWAELAPGGGLAPAINDRLRKASKK